jgi:hypothetical protein|tara:strand:+ start:919 stop:1122 length:204 start_codon:yes stop_codon:yes gene_type:complete
MTNYTVWVGGTEVTDNYVDFEEAQTIHNAFKERGYNDIIVQFEDVDPDAQTDREIQTEHWNSERLSE